MRAAAFNVGRTFPHAFSPDLLTGIVRSCARKKRRFCGAVLALPLSESQRN